MKHRGIIQNTIFQIMKHQELSDRQMKSIALKELSFWLNCPFIGKPEKNDIFKKIEELANQLSE